MSDDREIRKDGFRAGVAYAIAFLAREHGADDLAGFLAESTGFSVEDFERSKVDVYDLSVVRKVYRLRKFGSVMSSP